MPILSLDSQARLNIAQAILESTDERKAVRIIPLPSGDLLLMLSHFGQVSFDLIADGDDLFNPRLMVDVSALVIADMERNRELIAAASSARLPAPLLKDDRHA